MFFNGLRIQVSGAGFDAPLGAFSSGQVAQFDGTSIVGGPKFTGTFGTRDDAVVGDGTGALVPRQFAVRRVTGAAQTTNSTTYADVTNLTITINRTGQITFDYLIIYQTSAAAEGIGIQLAFTGTASGINYAIDMFTDPATRANLVTAGSFGSGLAPQAVGPGAVDVIARVAGSCNVTAVGDLSLQIRAETGGANTATVRVASWARAFAVT